MSLQLSQTDRIGLIHSSQVPDQLFLSRFEVTDKVNSPFEAIVDVLSDNQNIAPADLVGSQTTVEINLVDGQTRYFDGVVTSLVRLGQDKDHYLYQLVLRPWIWFAEKSQNQMIFHNQSVVDIITEVLGKWLGYANAGIDNRLTRTYAPMEYTVQYQETDLAFVSRLLEMHGISYHFTHELGQHQMVLTDANFEFDTLPEESLPLVLVKDHTQEGEQFNDWKTRNNLTTGAVRLTDYNFKKPNAAMEVDHQEQPQTASAVIESYSYPGLYEDAEEGKSKSKLRTLQAVSQGEFHYAEGAVISLGAGMAFQLTGDKDHLAVGAEYVCIEARQTIARQSYRSGGTGEGTEVTGEFVMVARTAPFAPISKTPAPRIYGPQTATVVGEGEIDCDEFGRILVQFPWDLAAAKSMRCRVAQISAHNGWGAVVLPRIGMEVIVEYLEGDPNKPVVTGSLYNGRNKPPIDLPGNKSQSGFVSQTHQGSGANEIRLEDQADKQEFNMVAERDFSLTAKNDAVISVGYEKGSPGNLIMNVHQDRTESVSNGDYNLGVDTGNRITYVKTDDTVNVDGNRSVKVKKTLGSEAKNVTVNGTTDLKIESPDVEVNGKTKTKIGSAKVEVDGTTVSLTGAQEISLSVGGSSIVLNAMGVTIKGPLVKIN